MHQIRFTYIIGLLTILSPAVYYFFTLDDYKYKLHTSFILYITIMQLLTYVVFILCSKQIKFKIDVLKKFNLTTPIMYTALLTIMLTAAYSVSLIIDGTGNRNRLLEHISWAHNPVFVLLTAFVYVWFIKTYVYTRRPLTLLLVCSLSLCMIQLSRTPIIFCFAVFIFVKNTNMNTKNAIIILITFLILITSITLLQGRDNSFYKQLFVFQRYATYSYYLTDILANNFSFWSLGGGLGYFGNSLLCDDCFSTSDLLKYHELGHNEFFANVAYSQSSYLYALFGALSIFISIPINGLVGYLLSKFHFHLTWLVILIQLSFFANNIFWYLTLEGIALIFAIFTFELANRLKFKRYV